MVLLFIFSIIGIVAGLVMLIGGLAESQGGLAAVGGLMLAVCIVGVVGIINTDAQRAVNNNSIHERIGIVTEINYDHIEIDNAVTYKISGAVQAQYDTSIEGIKIGESVKIKYLTGTVSDFAATIKPVTIVEEGAN
jgi:membrane protein implicated in regulation of membrane protease activity